MITAILIAAAAVVSYIVGRESGRWESEGRWRPWCACGFTAIRAGQPPQGVNHTRWCCSPDREMVGGEEL